MKIPVTYDRKTKKVIVGSKKLEPKEAYEMAAELRAAGLEVDGHKCFGHMINHDDFICMICGKVVRGNPS